MQGFPNRLFAQGNIDTFALAVDIGTTGKNGSVVKENSINLNCIAFLS